MGINFNSKILITNPTTHSLGRGVLSVGLIAIGLGGITYFTENFLFDWSGWIAIGIPMSAIGIILIVSSLRKN